MKISLDWLKTFIDLPESPEEVSRLLTGCGLEVEELNPIEAVPGGLAGVVVGEVLTCEAFEVKDKKLHLTTVNVGQESPATIVCGAANVAIGQKVLVATVGSTIYPIGGEAFTIGKRKVYGYPSEGMICAEDELGIGTSHAGIMVLTTPLPPGTPAAEYLGLTTDYQFVIGLTPNRADAASHFGVARDLKAILERNLQLPDIGAFRIDTNSHPIEVIVEDTTACPRFCGLTIDGVTVKDSPEWLKKRLSAIGIRSINNVVDVTNYVCHALGQPMHAYDWHALEDQKIIVKKVTSGTKFTTLDGTERTLAETDLMICDGQKPVGIAGVFGGQSSGVQPSTTRIFLEVAQFSADVVRKTALRHGLKTDASFRFERGTDPNAKGFVIQYAALLIQEVAGGKITSELIDTQASATKATQVEMKYKNIDRLIGKKIERVRIHKILTDLDMKIWGDSQDGFTVSVPPYRVDVTREADVIEEILRIYGLNAIELSEHLGAAFLAKFPGVSHDKERLQYKLSQWLVGGGFREIFTNSLTKASYAKYFPSIEPVEILNKLSEEHGILRTTMLFSGLESLAHNINRRQKNLKFFEFGKVYRKSKSRYVETPVLALFMTGDLTDETWFAPSQGVAFREAAAVLSGIFTKMGVQATKTSDIQQDEVLSYGLTYTHRKKELAKVAFVRPDVLKLCEIKQPVFYIEINWEALLANYASEVTFTEIPKFPEVRRDLSLVLDKSLGFEKIKEIAYQTENELLRQVNVFDVYEGVNLGESKKSYSVSFILQDTQQTLTDTRIDQVLNNLMNAFETKLGASIRK